MLKTPACLSGWSGRKCCVDSRVYSEDSLGNVTPAYILSLHSFGKLQALFIEENVGEKKKNTMERKLDFAFTLEYRLLKWT